MNTPMPVSFRRRSTLAAALFALAIGTVALAVTGGTEPASVAPPAAAVAAAPAAPAPTPTPATADSTIATSAIADHQTIVISRGSSLPAEIATADDPLAGVVVEPVDPAEALFGDHAAVAVSN